MSLYQNQKGTKSKIEDIVGDLLDAEKTAAMLNLIEFIRANKIGIQHASGNSWKMTYKSKLLGYFRPHDSNNNYSSGRQYNGEFIRGT